jgi:hypothetical protein
MASIAEAGHGVRLGLRLGLGLSLGLGLGLRLRLRLRRRGHGVRPPPPRRHMESNQYPAEAGHGVRPPRSHPGLLPSAANLDRYLDARHAAAQLISRIFLN